MHRHRADCNRLDTNYKGLVTSQLLNVETYTLIAISQQLTVIGQWLTFTVQLLMTPGWSLNERGQSLSDTSVCSGLVTNI